MRNFPLFLIAALAVILPSKADPASEALLAAATASNAEKLVLALAEAPPDSRGAQGRTALMLSAKASSFECAKRLLWAGADPRLKDDSGKTALDLLDSDSPAYGPLSLLLRCYAFCRENGRPGGKARIPNLALVNDMFVDYTHPALASSYAVNTAELKGKKGVDDDHNGFIDDVYGWNLNNDEPVTAPMLCLDGSDECRTFLAGMISDYLKANGGDEGIADRLRSRYDNPLVRQIGLQNLLQANIELNDLKYSEMFFEASHGTHVAGIIRRFSENKARITCATIGISVTPQASVVVDAQALTELAKKSPNYGEFVNAIILRFRAEAIAKGRRASDYLRASGAGVANMSWGREKAWFTETAEHLKQVYQKDGADPASIDHDYSGLIGERIAEFPLELCIANAASFALAFYENPDVFVVISAGNEHTDNDSSLPSPQYLSRFFPNVITIASTNDQGKPSSFTNFGVRSVQLAAPGEDIRSSILDGLEAPMSGTSMAAPLVAGIAAGIRADHPKISAADIRRILEYTAKRTPELATLVSSSGWVDAIAANKLAATWSGATGSMLLAEVARDRRPGQDGPKITAPKAAAPPKPKSPLQAKGWRITSSGGFSGSWKVVMSKPSPYSDQRHLGVGEWPAKDIDEAWQKGFRVTSIAGDADGWNVVMSQGVPGGQRILGLEFDQAELAKLMTEGWKITTIGGWNSQWAIALGDQTGYGNQRYTLPTPMTDSRREWIKKRWDEGYRITSIAGDDSPDNADDGWLLVMSQNSGLDEQTFSGPGPWPTDWIAAQQKDGYRITTIAGTPERALVVMSKGTKLGLQIISEGTDFPNDWIKDHW
jgi:subtilisin family serine protease